MARHTILSRPVDRAKMKTRLVSISNYRLRERIQCILWIDGGMDAKEAAEKIGRCRQSVAGFVNRYNEGGVDCLLRIGRGPGRQSKLKKTHRIKLLQWIMQGSRKQGLSFSNWDCPRLAWQIKRKWNISLSDEQVRRILHQEKCSLMRPRHKLPARNAILHSKKNGKFIGYWQAPKRILV